MKSIKFYSIIKFFYFIITGLIITACSNNENKSINSVENHINDWAKSQKMLEVESIKLIGTEEVGTKVSPETKYGLDVTFQVIDKTYRRKHFIEWMNIIVIDPDLEKGQKITKTINAKTYPKDGKIIVEVYGLPNIDSALLSKFINNGITEDNIIIIGQNSSSKAFDKLKNYYDEKLPLFEKLSLESQQLAQLKNTIEQSEKSKSVTKAEENLESTKRRMSSQERIALENQTNSIYAIQRNSEKIQKCIDTCQRRLNSDSILKRSVEREYGMNYYQIYCAAPVSAPSPGIKQCQEEVYASQITEINIINDKYRKIINDIESNIVQSAERLGNAKMELKDYRTEIDSKHQQKNEELSSLERKLYEVNNIINSIK